MTDSYKSTVEAVRGLDNDGTLDLAHSIVEALSDKDPTRHAIVSECMGIATMLLDKNAAYGYNALDPVRIFSRSSPEEQILVRIDDKLSRLSRGSVAGEDVALDLMGYLVLLRVARKAVA